MSDRYHIRVNKDQFVFSAAHFITYGDNICERLHGHNYRVEAEIHGPLGTHAYVVDFIAVRDSIQAIVAELDHRMLVPLRHPMIRVEESGHELTLHFEDRRWVFPREDCALLDVTNTTTELLASWIIDRFLQQIPVGMLESCSLIRVAVDENHGQWGICERPL